MSDTTLSPPAAAPPPADRTLIPLAETAPTVDVRLAGQALGIGATRAYELAKTGRLAEGVPVIKVGAKYRVVTSALRRKLGLDPTND